MVPVRRKRARAVTNEMLPRVAKWVEAFPYPTRARRSSVGMDSKSLLAYAESVSKAGVDEAAEEATRADSADDPLGGLRLGQ